MRKAAAGLVRLLLGLLIAVQTAWPAARQDWARLTVEKGLKPGQTVSMDEWNKFLDKLEELSRALPAVGKWDAASLWRDILVAQGIPPQPVWSEAEWKQLIPRLMAARPSVPAASSGAAVAQSSASAAVAPAPQASSAAQVRADPLLVLPTGAALVPLSGPAVSIGTASAAPAGPAPAAPPASAGQSPASDKKITLDLRDMDVVEVLKLLSRQYGLNIVVGKNVSGKVTVFLNGVDPWDALRTILETRDLAYVNEDGLIKVLTAADYEKIYGIPFDEKTEIREIPLRNARAATVKAFLEPFKSRVGSLAANEADNSLVVEDTPAQIEKIERMVSSLDVPMETRVFALSYGSAEEVLAKVAPLVSKEFGSAQADKRSNSLIVTANPARMAEVARIVQALDARNKAVLIEAKVVQILLNSGSQWGVNWQYIFSQMPSGAASVAGGVAGNFQLLPLQTLTRDANGNVSAQGVTGDLKVAQLPQQAQFSSIVNLLETAGKTRILSAPRIMALDGREASIHVGTEQPIITRNIVNPGSTTTQPIVTEDVKFEPVGVKLAVTPSIGADGYVTMKIRPEVSAVESTINTSNGSSIPIIRLSEAETSVLAKDGVTIVIGGLMEDNASKQESRVPLLGRIPLLGLPFRSRTRAGQKTELVFFLTPHITSGDTPAPEAEAGPVKLSSAEKD